MRPGTEAYVCVSSHVQHCDPVDCSPPGSSIHGFSRQEYWSRLPLSTLGDLPHPGITHMLLVPPALADGFSATETPGKSELTLREANSLVHSHPADKWLRWKLDCRRYESSVCVPNLAAYLGAADTRRDSSQSGPEEPALPQADSNEWIILQIG